MAHERFICGGEAAGAAARPPWSRRPGSSLMAGIAAADRATGSATSRPRSRTSAVAGGFGIVRGYGGHGIGTSMHEPPHVLNFRTRSIRASKLVPGHCLAIEPMLVMGYEATTRSPTAGPW